MTTYETANAYYFRSMLAIGGIESHLYYIAQKYGKYDITVFYRDANLRQVARLRRFVRCIELKPDDKVICENLFCCFNREILDQCEAKTKYLVLHGDYLDMNRRGQIATENLPMDDRIDKYVGVSRHVCDAWEELTGIKAEYIGEPVVLPKEKPLYLLSATRLSAEKGWGRMQILAKAMEQEGIDFEWFVYTNSPKRSPSPHIHFRDPMLGITGMMQMFDAYVQLSDNEGYCLSVVEALLQGVPCIVTDCPVFSEIGLNDTNSIILNHGMTDLPLGDIRAIKDLQGFKYKQPKDDWNKFLSHEKSTYGCITHRIRATEEWERVRMIDSEYGVARTCGEEWTVDDNRYQMLRDYEKRTGMHLIEVVDGEYD